MKECGKESLVYKMAALRCAGDVLHSSQEDRFSDMAQILIPLIKKVAGQKHCTALYCLPSTGTFCGSLNFLPLHFAFKTVIFNITSSKDVPKKAF